MAYRDYRLRFDTPNGGPFRFFTIPMMKEYPDAIVDLIAATKGTPFRVEVQLDHFDPWHEIDPEEH